MERSSMKRQNDQRIGEVLHQLVQNKKLKHKLFAKRIQSYWVEAMGPMIAEGTKAIEIRQQTLLLSVPSSTLRQELNLCKAEIINKLNVHLGEPYLKELRFI